MPGRNGKQSVTRAGLRTASSLRQIRLLPKFPHQERACEDTACRSVNHAALIAALTSWHSSDLRTQTEYYTLELPKGKPHTTFV